MDSDLENAAANLVAGVPVVSVTPLYCLVTDEDEIRLSDAISITRFSEEQLGFLAEFTNFVGHLRLYPPQCLLWERNSVSLRHFVTMAKELHSISKDRLGEINEGDLVRSYASSTPAMFPVMDSLVVLIRAFQLYRRGRLVVGDSFFSFTTPFPAGFMARCTEMTVDYQVMEQYEPSYEFNSTDVEDFKSFLAAFIEAHQTINKYPELQLAIARYCKETAQHGDVIDLMIALEALLVAEEEGIVFKLSQRVANLLGADATSRKELFHKIRDFYSLRSKMVHGGKPKPKELKAQEQLDDLREIARRVILSVIVLARDVGVGQKLSALLNDMCLDDDLRRATQEKVSALLR